MDHALGEQMLGCKNRALTFLESIIQQSLQLLCINDRVISSIFGEQLLQTHLVCFRLLHSQRCITLINKLKG